MLSGSRSAVPTLSSVKRRRPVISGGNRASADILAISPNANKPDTRAIIGNPERNKTAEQITRTTFSEG